ncbi:bifunctional diaminohydroxyphosphoribosylaminopyrimidine deaminase/5-amino-6-(5-phosphoribosylamino)uracil reductase RibD [Alteromonas sp. a30]|uniref:bifunctional diaminohydroxyphosphoribosylaminopyrimidine deaminase/5-amino-6-(5-phosphoribosylamino)uracil reductase RibD n=1 Tax=Alteromonas sp. a30 TaxID=2730917 RepID=UPI00228320D5|nr:bifunctional diaminohydroxyphosphoribosylaminopyrimidine deaminase/5-amino-6-(5-phosphoribosylamino)uracil reductase RibD [Alteromonas sp. a30]MCY7295889.1 bifunctional diaminohydroxyphosphoribosylaminopyrimidine deaminase/5-amino-6-(5-phosphoribosylamino)uracil reductase RibD [Alteromonas sp. a30]
MSQLTSKLNSQFDQQMMARALKLAEKGRFTTSPNPRVGCVITQNQRIVGEGYHFKAGEPHAEVHALREAGENAKGATAYVTLEPCSHYGRTPPCAEALINAGVARVVAAMQDPFDKVSGRGLQMLKAAGIDVQTGVLEAQAQRLNQGFVNRVKTGKPFVTAKMAASLDGKTALANGVSQWITAGPARADVQQFRAQSCAILTGSGTVLADNPWLNVRYQALGEIKNLLSEAEIRQPIRIVIDSQNQLHKGLQLFSLPGEVWVINLTPNANLPESVSQWQAPQHNGKVDLNAVMQYLGTQQINNLWVEAGHGLLGALMQVQLVDELIYYIAPKLMGNPAQGVLTAPEWQTMDQIYQLEWLDNRMVGQDLRLTAKVIYPSQ